MGIVSIAFRYPNIIVKVGYWCLNLAILSAAIYNAGYYEDMLFLLIWIGMLFGNWIVIGILNLILKFFDIVD